MKLGYANVDAMLASMTWEQFIEWTVYAELEPFDEERADVRAAQIATVIANVNRDSKKQSAYKLSDFLLHFGDWEAPKKTAKELLRLGKLMFTAFGGTLPPEAKDKKNESKPWYT